MNSYPSPYFFLFHPFDLISGSFFDSNYVMDDLIIIDKEVAWNLFGSTDVVGQVVNVGSRPHVVCGYPFGRFYYGIVCGQ